MPSHLPYLLTAVIGLARLGDFLALLGAALAFAMRRRDDLAGHLLGLFLGMAALLGFLQWAGKVYGFGTAAIGSLWDLTLLVFLIPASISVMRRPLALIIRTVFLVLLGLWFALQLFEDPFNLSSTMSLAIETLVGITGFFQLYQFLEDGLNLREKRGFFQAIAIILASLFDLVLDVSISSQPHEPLLLLRVARNSAWCISYILLCYAIYLGPRHARWAKPFPSVKDFFGTDHFETRSFW